MSYIHLNADNPFPVVTHRGLFELGVGEKEEIRFMTQDNGTVVCSYVVSMEATFDNAYARECRGIVFCEDGNVIARPLHKFFNVNEKETTRIENLPWDQVVRVMDKRDGSMIHTVNVGYEKSRFLGCNFDFKSKKSYKSDVAMAAAKHVESKPNYIDFCWEVNNAGLTAIFEWTSPTARIVLPYQRDELKLLHIRDNVTGAYFTKQRLEVFAKDFGIPLVDDVNLDGDNWVLTAKGGPVKYTLTKDRPLIDQFLELAETLEGTEGWVFQFVNGDMVKLKTKDYMNKHRAMTFLRERDIALLVADEQIDDLKAMLVGEGCNITQILEIEKDVVEYIETMISSVEGVYAEIVQLGLSKKDAALKYGSAGDKHQYFGLLMRKMDGKEPNYLEYFKKNVLHDRYDLKQLNLTDSVAEVE